MSVSCVNVLNVFHLNFPRLDADILVRDEWRLTKPALPIWLKSVDYSIAISAFHPVNRRSSHCTAFIVNNAMSKIVRITANSESVAKDEPYCMIMAPMPVSVSSISAVTMPLTARPMPNRRPGHDRRHGRRQHDLEENFSFPSAEGARHLDENGVDLFHAGHGVDDDDKDREKKNHGDARLDAQTEPQDEHRARRRSSAPTSAR